MCKICKKYYGEDLVELASEKIKLKDVTIFHNELWMENGYLESCVANATSDYVSTAKIKIKYCPFCGEELK